VPASSGRVRAQPILPSQSGNSDLTPPPAEPVEPQAEVAPAEAEAAAPEPEQPAYSEPVEQPVPPPPTPVEPRPPPAAAPPAGYQPPRPGMPSAPAAAPKKQGFSGGSAHFAKLVRRRAAGTHARPRPLTPSSS